MSYLEWFNAHAQKHHHIVKKLLNRGVEKEAIIDYFDFENMVEKEPEFCELYTTKTKCHEMKHLNCYLCACPNFRFNDNAAARKGIITHSHCNIDAKDGAVFTHGKSRHQDCSGCTVPHHRSYVEKHFDTDWHKIMAACRSEKD